MTAGEAVFLIRVIVVLVEFSAVLAYAHIATRRPKR